MVDSLFMFIVCNAGLCFFFIFLYCGELTQCVYGRVFFIFWSNEKVCGIHLCFWPISFVRAVHLARFVSSGVSANQNLEVFRDWFWKQGEERNCYAVWFTSGRLSKFCAFFLPVFLPLRTIV